MTTLTGRSILDHPEVRAAREFFITGGTLKATASCYVTRKADSELMAAIRAGELCYILNTRQMGKSSLMVRAARQIRQDGGHAVIIDLTSLGYNLTLEQWYLGLLVQVHESTDNPNDIVVWWNTHKHLGPAQRFIDGIIHLLSGWKTGVVGLFIDEIDSVRLLPFSSDEFFAALRELHNRKAVDPVCSRLAVCLLGVSTPADLISNKSITPFNVGVSIVLTDFSEPECSVLWPGLSAVAPGRRRKALARVLYWTGGHPYLTLRLCSEIASSPGAGTRRDVDAACERVFFAQDKRVTEPNISFVENRIADSANRIGLLQQYHRVLRREPVRYIPGDACSEELLLSGLVKVSGGCLVSRNRIYNTIFDGQWIETHLPSPETQIRRRIYLQGLFRGALGASAVLALAVLVRSEISLFERISAAERATKSARNTAIHNSYDAAFQSIANHAEGISAGLAKRLLIATTPAKGEPDNRNFEWYYLNKINAAQALEVNCPPDPALETRFSPSGRMLGVAFGSELDFFDPAHGYRKASGSVSVNTRSIGAFDFDAVSLRPYYVGDGGKLLCPASNSHPEVQIDLNIPGSVTTNEIDVSNDGKIVAIACSDGVLRLVHPATCSVTRIPNTGRLPLRGIWSAALRPGNREVAGACDDGIVRIWDTVTGRLLRQIEAHTGYIFRVIYSPDGSQLASAGEDGSVVLRSASDLTLIHRFAGHTSYIYGLAFSRDGTMLASAGWDKLIIIHSMKTMAQLSLIRTNTTIWSLAFNPVRDELAVGNGDGILQIYPVARNPAMRLVHEEGNRATQVAVSTDGKQVAAVSLQGDCYLYGATVDAPNSFIVAAKCTISTALSSNTRVMARLLSDRWQIVDTRTSDILSECKTAIMPSSRASVSRGGLTLAITHGDTCDVWSTLSHKKVWSTHMPNGCTSTLMSPDGSHIVCYSGGSPVVFAVGTPKPVAMLEGGSPSLDGLKFSSDGKQIYGVDGVVHVWNADTGSSVTELGDPLTRIIACVITGDGSRIITAGSDRIIRVWDSVTHRVIMELQGDGTRPEDLAISPDNMCLAVALRSGTLRLWYVGADSKTQEALRPRP